MPQHEHQVTSYLTTAEREQFERYARNFFLDAAGLLALLLARETRVGQLCALTKTDTAPQTSRNAKITARLKAEEHAMLTKMAKDNGVSLSQAGAMLVRAELNVRWLENACSTRFES
jgi:hypothetical protein